MCSSFLVWCKYQYSIPCRIESMEDRRKKTFRNSTMSMPELRCSRYLLYPSILSSRTRFLRENKLYFNNSRNSFFTTTSAAARRHHLLRVTLNPSWHGTSFYYCNNGSSPLIKFSSTIMILYRSLSIFFKAATYHLKINIAQGLARCLVSYSK